MKLTKTEIKAVLNMVWDIEKRNKKENRTNLQGVNIEGGFIYITDGHRALKINQKELGLVLEDGNYTLVKTGNNISFDKALQNYGLTQTMWNTVYPKNSENLLELKLLGIDKKNDKINLELDLIGINRPMKNTDIAWLKLFSKSTITAKKEDLPIIVTNPCYEALIMPLKVAS